jgi:hypothetical protein
VQIVSSFVQSAVQSLRRLTASARVAVMHVNPVPQVAVVVHAAPRFGFSVAPPEPPVPLFPKPPVPELPNPPVPLLPKPPVPEFPKPPVPELPNPPVPVFPTPPFPVLPLPPLPKPPEARQFPRPADTPPPPPTKSTPGGKDR